MEAPSWGPSTCVVLDDLKDGGGEEDGMRFTQTCLKGGQRWSIPPQASSAWELPQSFFFPKAENTENKLLTVAAAD